MSTNTSYFRFRLVIDMYTNRWSNEISCSYWDVFHHFSWWTNYNLQHHVVTSRCINLHSDVCEIDDLIVKELIWCHDFLLLLYAWCSVNWIYAGIGCMAFSNLYKTISFRKTNTFITLRLSVKAIKQIETAQ